MYLSSIVWVLLISLFSCAVAAPTPDPISIEIHWQAGVSGITPKTPEDHANLAKLRGEVETTMTLLVEFVTAAHTKKDTKSRQILHELANPHVSITDIYKFVRFFQRYTLRIYEFSFKNSADRKKTLAHINTGPVSDRMSISEKFWKQSMDDQVGTIFHEVSHRAGTVDWWKERADGSVTPMNGEPSGHKEKPGTIMGYRHKSYWKVHKNSGSKFILNADFWYVLAVYVRRMKQGLSGDELYPLSLRKSHPEMKKRLTPELQHTVPFEDPEPTQDNDGFQGVVDAAQQQPYYDQQHVALEGDSSQVAAGVYDMHAMYGTHVAPDTHGAHPAYGGQVAPDAHVYDTHGAQGAPHNPYAYDPYAYHDVAHDPHGYGAHVAVTPHAAPNIHGYDVHGYDAGVGPSTAPVAGLADEMSALNVYDEYQDDHYASDGGGGGKSSKGKGKGKGKKDSGMANFFMGGGGRKGRK